MENPITLFEGLYHKNPKAALAMGAAGGGAVLYFKLRKPASPPADAGTSNPAYGTVNGGVSGNGILGWVGNGPAVQGPAGPAGPTGATGAPGAPGGTVATPKPKPTPGKEQLYNLNIPAPALVQQKYDCPAGYHFAPEVGGTGNWVCRPNKGGTGGTGTHPDIMARPKTGQGGPYSGDVRGGSVQPYGGAAGFSPVSPFLPREHIVQEGDTLGGIGRRYWGNPAAGEKYIPQVQDSGLVAGQKIRLY